MIKRSIAIACVLASVLPPMAARAGLKGPPASYSCFQSPDHCLKVFAKTHDREDYELCMLSESVCRSYRYNWQLMKPLVTEDSGIPSDCLTPLLRP